MVCLAQSRDSRSAYSSYDRLSALVADILKVSDLLGHNLGDHEVVWHDSTAITAGVEGDMEFWVPRGRPLQPIDPTTKPRTE